MNGTTTVYDLVSLLKKHRFNYSNEKDLQEGIASLLIQNGIWFTRETPLGEAGIIDFMLLEGIGIEVKIKGSPVEVARQLLRYAGHREITQLILVTGRTRLGKLPPKLFGKPITVVSMWESFL